MKRSFSISLALAALVLVAAAALAGDRPSTPPTSSEPAMSHAKSVHHMKGTAEKAKHARTDINAASKEDLMKLPGITSDLADRIIAARPFKSRDELVSKNILTKAEYTKVHSSVMAKSTAMAPSK